MSERLNLIRNMIDGVKDQEPEGSKIPVSGMELTPDEALAMNIGIRNEIALNMVKDGVPTDRRELRLLNEILSSNDTTILGAKRAGIEEGQANNDARAVELLGEIFDKIGNDNPHESNDVIEGEVIDSLPEDFHLDVIQEDGEMGVGVSDDDFESFSSRHLKK